MTSLILSSVKQWNVSLVSGANKTTFCNTSLPLKDYQTTKYKRPAFFSDAGIYWSKQFKNILSYKLQFSKFVISRFLEISFLSNGFIRSAIFSIGIFQKVLLKEISWKRVSSFFFSHFKIKKWSIRTYLIGYEPGNWLYGRHKHYRLGKQNSQAKHKWRIYCGIF